jgi:hypothetical protein
MYNIHTIIMADSIIDGTHIDTSVFSYSAPKAHSSGGKVVNLYNKHFRESLTISTPLILTWGAQEGKDQQGNPTGKYTMSLQFPSTEYSTPELESFLSSMQNLETQVKTDALTHSKEWFGKVITNPEIMDEKFNVMLRYPKIKGTQEPNLTKFPTLTVKIPCWNNVWKTEIYDEDGEPLFVTGKVNSHLNPLEFLKPKTHVICLIQCGGLWFVNGKVSITWNLKQAIVQKPKQSMEGQCFIRLKTSDKERLKSLPPVEDDVLDDGVVSTQVVDSDDEEQDSTEYELPAPAPVPEPVPDMLKTPERPVQDTETMPVKPKKRVIRSKKNDA